MLEAVGNIWAFAGEAVIVITTSGSVAKNGRAILGRGVARQALIRYPDLPETLGRLLVEKGNHVHLLEPGLVSFPVEETAWSLPDMRLIECSARELRLLADREGWLRVMVPQPGCGGGGLLWQDVRQVIAPHLDSRFTIISCADQNGAKEQPGRI